MVKDLIQGVVAKISDLAERGQELVKSVRDAKTPEREATRTSPVQRPAPVAKEAPKAVKKAAPAPPSKPAAKKPAAKKSAASKPAAKKPAAKKSAASSAKAGDLESMTRKELYAMAQELDIAGRKDMRKAQLVAAIKEHKK